MLSSSFVLLILHILQHAQISVIPSQIQLQKAQRFNLLLILVLAWSLDEEFKEKNEVLEPKIKPNPTCPSRQYL